MDNEQYTLKNRFKEFVRECGRVLKVTKKPTMKEYKIITLITGAGILVIGFIGFVITIITQMF
ncbi:MAG: protein translocase SEC61 complex subunit gamma [Candidatus Woesearchaeota archaeon]